VVVDTVLKSYGRVTAIIAFITKNKTPTNIRGFINTFTLPYRGCSPTEQVKEFVISLRDFLLR